MKVPQLLKKWDTRDTHSIRRKEGGTQAYVELGCNGVKVLICCSTCSFAIGGFACPIKYKCLMGEGYVYSEWEWNGVDTE